MSVQCVHHAQPCSYEDDSHITNSIKSAPAKQSVLSTKGQTQTNSYPVFLGQRGYPAQRTGPGPERGRGREEGVDEEEKGRWRRKVGGRGGRERKEPKLGIYY